LLEEVGSAVKSNICLIYLGWEEDDASE
jgi:hypothetical protein